MTRLRKLVAFTFVVACVGGTLSAPLRAEDGSLSGQVVDGGGRGIANLTVKLSAGGGDYVTVTDSMGRFELHNVRSGNYGLIVKRGLNEVHRESVEIRGALVRVIRL
jgi:hypothetical protein